MGSSTTTVATQSPAAFSRLIGQPTSATHPHLVGPTELTPGISREDYRARRAALAASLPPGGRAVLVAPPIAFYSNDIPLSYHPDPDFYYFTGLAEPNAVAVIARADSFPPAATAASTATSVPGPSGSKSKGYSDFLSKEPSALAKAQAGDVVYALFVRPREPAKEIWDGPMTGLDGAQQYFEADVVGTWEQAVTDGLVDSKTTATPGSSGSSTAGIWRPTAPPDSAAVSQGPAAFSMGKYTLFPGPGQVAPIIKSLEKLRLIKSPAELDLMRRSAALAADSFRAVMAAATPGVSEGYLATLFESGCRLSGATRNAYPSVVASGSNALTLHYIQNNALVQEGDLVLMDAGTEYAAYASDITRTFPISGKFTEPQAKLYNMVLAVQEATLAVAVADGRRSLNDLHRFSIRATLAGLRNGGFLQNQEVSDAELWGAITGTLYPHHVTHYLGMDTHDCHSLSRDLPLAPGQVITVEPGFYVPHGNSMIKPEFHGIGIRIEDDIVITDGPPEVLTAAVPKTVPELEALVGSGRPW